MSDIKKYEIISSDEYKAYIKALCRLASQYIAEIRQKYAARAYELYANETIRQLVLAYGEEVEKLDQDRLRDFSFVAEYPNFEGHLEDSCLNNARHYEAAIKFFFLGK